jgi:hypothetical protein
MNGLEMRITNIYISSFFQYFIAILTYPEINWANQPERQIAPLSPIKRTQMRHTWFESKLINEYADLKKIYTIIITAEQ